MQSKTILVLGFFCILFGAFQKINYTDNFLLYFGSVIICGWLYKNWSNWRKNKIITALKQYDICTISERKIMSIPLKNGGSITNYKYICHDRQNQNTYVSEWITERYDIGNTVNIYHNDSNLGVFWIDFSSVSISKNKEDKVKTEFDKKQTKMINEKYNNDVTNSVITGGIIILLIVSCTIIALMMKIYP